MHAVAHDTARTDILILAEKFDFLLKEKKGKGYIFRSPSNQSEGIQNQIHSKGKSGIKFGSCAQFPTHIRPAFTRS